MFLADCYWFSSIFHMNFIYFFNWLKNNPFPLEIIKSKFSVKIETISHSYLRFIFTPIYFVGVHVLLCYLYLFTYTGVQHDFHVRWYLCYFTVARQVLLMEQELTTLPQVFCRSSIVLLAIVLSLLLRFTASDDPLFGILKIFLENELLLESSYPIYHTVVMYMCFRDINSASVSKTFHLDFKTFRPCFVLHFITDTYVISKFSLT
jgi:hypothetical protein